jgi:lytic murein transglycosylase
MDRRYFISTCAALALTACAPDAAPPARASLPRDLQPVPNVGFDGWITGFKVRAGRSGIPATVLDRAFASAGYLPGVVTRDRNQIQTRRTFEDYLAIAASDDRITKGRAAYARHATVLDAIAARYGVDPHIITAIWGLESRYGVRRGAIPVISATATLAFDGRRARFYEAQLMAALRILARGDTTPAQLTGSWAGAMGHTQFIPTSYEATAVDFDGDGRRDIWGDDPTDALASTARYLARNGWRGGLKWGAEDGTSGPAGRLIRPQRGGVGFRVSPNFDVLKTYNNSDFYAVGVGHLADRISGQGPLRGQFPPDRNGLNKSQRLAIQRQLAARGYDVGTIDGVIGDKTTVAISAFQTRQGMAATGVADRAMLAMLQ